MVTKELWFTCAICDHTWKGADLPMELEDFAKKLRKTKCPACGEHRKIKFAKKDALPESEGR